MSEPPRKRGRTGASLEDVVMQTVNEASRNIGNLKTLNIVVNGKTGAGKSTLINALFGFDEARTGAGKPVTSVVRSYSKPGVPLVVYDTPGFELGKENQEKVKKDVLELISSGVDTRDVSQTIHCVLYCINVGSNRVEPAEIEWLRSLTRAGSATKVPVIVVLTQCCQPRQKIIDMRATVERAKLPIVGIFEVIAKESVIEAGPTKVTVPPSGLEELISVMGKSLPKEVIDTFWSVQKVSLAEKRSRSHKAVAVAAAAAAAIGAIPIPFSDAALLIPTQTAMLASITVTFGLDVTKSFFSQFISTTIGAGGAAILGPTVVTSILKFIPGVGSLLGGVIAAGTAAAITTALGETYIAIMTKLFKGEIKMEDLTLGRMKSVISGIFKDELVKAKKK